MKEYNVKLTQNEQGHWQASTPKTSGNGDTASAALRSLADTLERKGAQKDPQQEARKRREAADRLRAAASSGDPVRDFMRAVGL
jgi:hypothetical protein